MTLLLKATLKTPVDDDDDGVLATCTDATFLQKGVANSSLIQSAIERSRLSLRVAFCWWLM